MRERISLIFVAAVFFAVGAGCSVKEDRRECPCRLVLDLREVSLQQDDCLELNITSESETVFSARLDSSSFREELVIDVPRKPLKLMAWCGDEGMTGNGGLVIPLGSQCPQVYTCQSELLTVGESFRDTLVMRKNHCVLSVLFRQDETEFVRLSLRGEVCGYDSDGIPVEGEFLASVVRDSSAVVACPQVVLPRQQGGELYLDVEDDRGKVKSFPLSDFIEATGYDWDAPDLPDLIVTVDYVLTGIFLEIQGWDEEFFFDVVI